MVTTPVSSPHTFPSSLSPHVSAKSQLTHASFPVSWTTHLWPPGTLYLITFLQDASHILSCNYSQASLTLPPYSLYPWQAPSALLDVCILARASVLLRLQCLMVSFCYISYLCVYSCGHIQVDIFLISFCGSKKKICWLQESLKYTEEARHNGACL